ncbi:hypothetical protein [Botryobacter ruber]|uniref:hypothetical protein n=1 Tax=Botryobacter ruber TaxID=2171629 RepID=UPI000E0C1911|nr:hypothetical protein [Botryobacter ruber]
MLITAEQARAQRAIDEFMDSLADSNLTLYASDFLKLSGCHTMEEIGQALMRATAVCNNMHLPLRENIKVVYRSQDGTVVPDFRLSPMAYMLMVINSDTCNNLVARTQAELVMRMLRPDMA